MATGRSCAATRSQIYDMAGEPVERKRQQSLGTSFMVDKGNHRHFMEKEIHEQPEVISPHARALSRLHHRRDRSRSTCRSISPKIDRLAISACGTAYLAGPDRQILVRALARLPVDIDIASEFRYREMPLSKDGAALFVSQSGETADTLASLRYCRKAGVPIGAIVNVRESTIARESDVVLPTLAGPEIGVASTKAFTCQLSVLAVTCRSAPASARGTISAERGAGRWSRSLVRGAALRQPGAEAREPDREGRPRALALQGRALSRPRHQLSAGHGRRAQAQGNLLHPRRGLCRRRVEARADRADRREHAGHRHRAARPHLRKDGVEHAGGRGARRQDHPDHRPEGRRRRHGEDDGDDRAARRAGDHRADDLRAADPDARLPHGRLHGHRRRPAAQPGEVGDGRVEPPNFAVPKPAPLLYLAMQRGSGEPMSDSPGVISGMTRLRNYFLTGFIVAAPLAITVYIVWSFIGWIDSWVKPYIPAAYSPDTYLPFALPGFGLLVAIFVITMIGFLAANIVGRSIVSVGEHLLGRMPLVRGVYKALKQIFETVLSNKNDMFRQVGLVEYPRKGVWSLVFVANEKETEINVKLDKEGDPLVAVFMPCTPNPTTGFLMYVYRSEIVLLDMTIEDGAKLIVSAGLVAPEYKRKVVTKDGAPIEVGLANPTVEKVANLKFK